MIKYAKKTIHAKITRWFKHDDHEKVGPFYAMLSWDEQRHGMKPCSTCGDPRKDNGKAHGVLLRGGKNHVVCPGYYIIEPVHVCGDCGGKLYKLNDLPELCAACEDCGELSIYKQIKTGEIYVLSEKEYEEQGWEIIPQ